MNNKIILEGERFKVKLSRKIGKGGNGVVYKVKIIEGDVEYPVVAKLFNYSDKYKEQRYKRFKREVTVTSELQSERIKVLEIIDSNIPDEVPDNPNEAWYLMPEGEEYSLNKKRDFLTIINDMLELAAIIVNLKKLGYAHRDIKPKNLIVLNGKIYLADYGLVWSKELPQITGEHERVGPVIILPPELENIILDEEPNIDYCYSDVYLFAKVLWMVIKKNESGFGGKYDRSDKMTYLKPEDYNLYTMEPIHYLLENATHNEILKRLTIEECIEQLELQKKIIEEKLDPAVVDELRFREVHKELINAGQPDKYIYKDGIRIVELINTIIKTSKVTVQAKDNSFEKQIQVSNIKLLSGDLIELSFFRNGKKIKEYIFNAIELTCPGELTFTDAIVLNLANVEGIENDYTEFSELEFGMGDLYNKIVINEEYKIVIEKQ